MARPRSGVRVIAGSAKGRRLETPPGLGTRPVTDRVKESIFSMLQPGLPGARVLDLYAGSGALAIEALSRGAEAAVLVERDSDVVRVVEANLAKTGFDDRARAVRGDVLTYLGRAPTEAFDLVFLDPPYAVPTSDVEEAFRLLAGGWLDDDATVVARRQRKSEEPTLPPGLEFARAKRYGDTVVLVAVASEHRR